MEDVNPADLSRRMIDEGARILAEQGPAGLSLRKLATSCGTSTMAVYTRFGDKSGLLAAMHREGFRRLGDRLREVAPADGSLTTLAELGRAYRLAALESRHLYGLMFGTRPPDLRPDEDGDEAATATFLPLLEGVRDAVTAGVLVGHPEHIALHLWVVAHGMVSLELSGHLPLTTDAAHAYDDGLAFAATPFLPR